MSGMTSFFLPPEFAEIGLAAAADPGFAEQLIEALQRLATAEVVDPRLHGMSADGPSTSDQPEVLVDAL